jgi:TolA-binding protein
MAGLCYSWAAKKYGNPEYVRRKKAAFLRVIKEYPKSFRRADAYLYLAQNYSGHTFYPIDPIDCPKAIRLYRKAVKAAKRRWIKAQALGRIGQCYIRMKKLAKALAIWREVARKYPDTAWCVECEGLLRKYMPTQPISPPGPSSGTAQPSGPRQR